MALVDIEPGIDIAAGRVSIITLHKWRHGLPGVCT